MLRSLTVCALLALAPAATLASAAWAGTSKTQIANAKSTQPCVDTAAKRSRRAFFGNLISGAADTAIDRAGVPTIIGGVRVPVGTLLSDAILKLLNCGEQQQAAQATDKAIRGGVGTQVSWKSESRPNVSGSSKVTSSQKLADGGQCLTVTDVVIVDGEETTIPKRMCRAAGASGYARV